MSSRSFLYFSSFDLFVLSFYTCYNYFVGLLQIVFSVLNQGFDYRPILKWLTINWHGFNSSEIQEKRHSLLVRWNLDKNSKYLCIQVDRTRYILIGHTYGWFNKVSSCWFTFSYWFWCGFYIYIPGLLWCTFTRKLCQLKFDVPTKDR